MTRLALVEPQSGGGNWWAVVEVPWSKQAGPPRPQLMIAMLSSLPFTPSGAARQETAIDTVQVTFVKMTHPRAAPLWVAQIDAPSETTRLLNIAYTCPETHVHWRAAQKAREWFERALGVKA